MNLLFLRHAPAEDLHGYAKDAERPLSTEGTDAMRTAARGIQQVFATIDGIFSSPYLRARQTAEIVQEAYTEKPTITLAPDITPEGPTSAALAVIDALPADGVFMLVSHEPLLSTMTSLLLGASRPVVEFKKGTLVHLELFGPGMPAVLKASFTPKSLRMLGRL